MKSQMFSPLAILCLMVVGFAGKVCAQQPHTVQSAAPAIQMPASTLPVNVDPEAGKLEIKSTTSEAIDGARPVEATLPSTGGSQQNTASEIDGGTQTRSSAPCSSGMVPAAGEMQRTPTPAEIEELKDGK